MGLGVIRIVNRKPEVLLMDVLRLEKLGDHPLKLKKIFETTLRIIEQYHPDELAIEAPFFGKNVQSMLKLGRAQGVAIAAALYRDIPVFEYAPRKIKQSITGKGNASKEQVAGILQNLLAMPSLPETLDVSDALAVAVCHYFQQGKPAESATAVSGWKAFIAQNPSRVIKK